jgi:hypothetical protein
MQQAMMASQAHQYTQQAHQFHGQTTHDFFVANGLTATQIPGDHIDVQGIDHGNGQFTIQQPTPQSDYASHMLSSISEAPQNGTVSHAAILQSMIAAGYDMHGLDYNADGADNLTKLENAAQSFRLDSSFSIPAQMGATGGQSSDLVNGASAANLDYATYTAPGSSPMQATERSGSTCTDPSVPSLSSSAPLSQSTTSLNPMSSGTPSFNPCGDEQGSIPDMTPGQQLDNPFEYGMQNSIPASGSQISLHQLNNPTYLPMGMYHHNNSSTQVILSPEQMENPFYLGDLDPPNAPFMHSDALSRRSSSTSGLAESFSQGLNVQGSPSTTPTNGVSDNGGFKQPSAPLSIAARRQRHPAGLNSLALRSSSYTAGMPGSPGASNNIPGEHSLRRIRSAIGNGSTGGRISKNSGQRSPFAASFEQAANSPKFAREYVSAVSTPGLAISTGSLAPPTPCTPNDSGHFPSWQSTGVVKTRPPIPDASSPPDSLGIKWASEPNSAEAFGNAASPPRTPLEPGQLNQLKMNNMGLYRDTPPQSAPATQANFPRPMFAPPQPPQQEYLTPPDYQKPGSYAPNHFRRPSLPVGNTQNSYSEPPIPLQQPQLFNAAGDLHINYPVQYHTQSTNGYVTDGFGTYNPHEMAALAAASGTPASNSGANEISIHQYVPPEGVKVADQHHPRHFNNEQKSYTFVHNADLEKQQKSKP